jgi:hypothetical protein
MEDEELFQIEEKKPTSAITGVDNDTGKKNFTIKGYEKREYKIERGNAGSSKLLLPPDWVGRTITVVLQD